MQPAFFTAVLLAAIALLPQTAHSSEWPVSSDAIPVTTAVYHADQPTTVQPVDYRYGYYGPRYGYRYPSYGYRYPSYGYRSYNYPRSYGYSYGYPQYRYGYGYPSYGYGPRYGYGGRGGASFSFRF